MTFHDISFVFLLGRTLRHFMTFLTPQAASKLWCRGASCRASRRCLATWTISGAMRFRSTPVLSSGRHFQNFRKKTSFRKLSSSFFHSSFFLPFPSLTSFLINKAVSNIQKGGRIRRNNAVSSIKVRLTMLSGEWVLTVASVSAGTVTPFFL